MNWSFMDAVVGSPLVDEIALMVRIVFERAPNNLPSIPSELILLQWGCELRLEQLLQQAGFGVVFAMVHGFAQVK